MENKGAFRRKKIFQFEFLKIYRPRRIDQHFSEFLENRTAPRAILSKEISVPFASIPEVSEFLVE